MVIMQHDYSDQVTINEPGCYIRWISARNQIIEVLKAHKYNHIELVTISKNTTNPKGLGYALHYINLVDRKRYTSVVNSLTIYNMISADILVPRFIKSFGRTIQVFQLKVDHE